jgi:hypothetical protein
MELTQVGRGIAELVDLIFFFSFLSKAGEFTEREKRKTGE